LLANIAWINSNGGSWQNASNWNPAVVPGPADDVVIGVDGNYTVTLDGTTSVLSLEVGATSGSQTLVANSSLTLANASVIHVLGIVNLDNNSITANSELRNEGVLQSRGISTINGSFVTAADSILRVRGQTGFGQGILTVSSGFTNNGTIEVTSIVGGDSNANATLNVNGVLVNAPGRRIEILQGQGGTRALNASLDNQGDITVNSSSGLTVNIASADHLNSGTIHVSAGDLTVSQSGSTSTFTNSGTIDIGASRTLTFNGGTFNLNPGTNLTGNGGSLVRHSRVTAETLWELKSQLLRKSGLVQLYRGTEDFSSLGGLVALKAFCRRSLLQPGRENPLKRPRGVLLLGVPGTGKSAFAKALGAETGRPTLVLDIGALMGSLVGQTEGNIRQALKIADAMAPCILFADEIEKALSGVASSGDSGVSARLFGTLLSWMNDHTSDVYLIATCNDISRLPPEFSRAERFDGVVFLDLPGTTEKTAIWDMYLRTFELDPTQRRPDDVLWTGAEIRACCRLAALLDVPLIQAAQSVVPVAVTAAESVERLRTWASGRCLSAETSGIYVRSDGLGGSRCEAKGRRSIKRDPSNN
jgi:chloramphenicol 3-O-phosphotransferase